MPPVKSSFEVIAISSLTVKDWLNMIVDWLI